QEEAQHRNSRPWITAGIFLSLKQKLFTRFRNYAGSGAKNRIRNKRLRLNHQVDRLGTLALLVRFNLESDALSFGQILQSRPFDRGDVHEHVTPAIVRLDEAVATLSIEELDRTSHGHRDTPPP